MYTSRIILAAICAAANNFPDDYHRKLESCKVCTSEPPITFGRPSKRSARRKAAK